MKKLKTLFVMMFLLIGTFAFVLAEDNTTESGDTIYSENLTDDVSLPEPGNSGWFGNNFDKWRLAWTFNNEKKIEKALNIAEKRLAEAEAIAEEDPERAERIREQYNHFVEKAEEAMGKMEERRNENPKDLNESMREMAKAQARMEEHRARAILAHEEILGRMRAKNMSEEDLEFISEIFERFENRSEMLNEQAEQRRKRVETKYRVLAEINDSEMKRLREHIDEEEGYEEAHRMRELRDYAREGKEEEFQERLQEQIRERLEEHSNLTEEEKQEIKERLESSAEEFKKRQEARLNA